MASIKWYWWVLLGLAVLLTIYVVIVSARSNPKKVEKKLVESDPDLALTSVTPSYQTVGRIADAVITSVSTKELETGSLIKGSGAQLFTGGGAGWTKEFGGYNTYCAGATHHISQADLDANFGGSPEAWTDEICYGKIYTVK